MTVSLSASLNVKNSVPLPGGRCKYTGQSVLKHYCCIEDVQIRSNPKNARKVSLSASLNTKNSVPLSGGRCKYTGQSVRALPIRILTVGKKRSRGVQVIVDEYIEKLKHYCRIEDVQIRSNPKNARFYWWKFQVVHVENLLDGRIAKLY